MPATLLLVGTRKGLFVLESDDGAPRLEGTRPVLRGLADLPRGARSGIGCDLRRGRKRVARRRDLAQRRPRGDLGAVQRGNRATSRRRAEDLEGLEPERRARARARGRRGRRYLREQDGGATWSLLSYARGRAWPRGMERPGEPAARPSRPLRDDAPSGRLVPLLGDRPGLRHLRDDRRRRFVDAA